MDAGEIAMMVIGVLMMGFIVTVIGCAVGAGVVARIQLEREMCDGT